MIRVNGQRMWAVILAAGLTVAAPAMAEKGGNGHGGPHKAEQARNQGAAQGKEDSDLFGFNEREMNAIAGVLRALYGDTGQTVEIVRPSREFCPPGLARKNNGCMPPGQAKKYSIGSVLSDDVQFSEISPALRRALGAPPKGREYVQVDNDILLIERTTQLVLDAVGVSLK